jgi:hypothetical protein
VHAASGWYPDPARPGTQRYWDGSAWTDERPVPVEDPSEAMRVAPVRSTVGFELPSHEALDRMGAGGGAVAGAAAGPATDAAAGEAAGESTEKTKRAGGRRRASRR